MVRRSHLTTASDTLVNMVQPNDRSSSENGRTAPIDTVEVLAHVDELTGAEEFARSERRRELLRYLVEETLAGSEGSLKAYTIGRKALGRPPGFDPQTDPIVRVEIGRLRATLDRYYRTHPEAPLVIGIPKGRYTAEFTVVEKRPSRAAIESTAGAVHIERFRATSQRSLDLSDAIIDALAAIVVRATNDPTSVMTGDAAAIDGACTVRGSLRTVQDRVRVSVEVLVPGRDSPIASRTFDDDLADGHEFDLVDRVAERIGWILLDDWGPLFRRGWRLTDRTSPHHTRLARETYYEAFRNADPTDVVAAAETLAPVAAGDARTLAALSDATTVSWMLSAELAPEVRDRAEELAIRAVALDPGLVEAHLALGYAHAAKSRSGLMKQEFEAALGLGPPSPNTLHCVAIMLAFDGSWERAESMAARALDLNPDLPNYWHLVPCIAALHRGESDRAYVESLQIGETIGFAGPALRLASAFSKGLPAIEDAKQFASMTPEPTVQPIEDTVDRVFHDPVVRDLVLRGVHATGVAAG